MNKTSILLCSLLGIATSALAQGPVYSVNIVGIQKTQIDPGSLQLLGTPFNIATQNINQVMGQQLTTGFGTGTGDAVFFWTGSAYKSYFRLTPVGDPRDNQWIDESGNLATDPVPPGVGFWVKNNQVDGQEVAMVGEVELRATVTKQINPGLQIVT